MVNELVKVSDEPGHSATGVAEDEPTTVTADNFPVIAAGDEAEKAKSATEAQAATEKHPYDEAIDAFCASAKAVRVQKVELTKAIAARDAAAAVVNAANLKLAELADAETKAFAALQTEREAADLPTAPPADES